MEQVYEYLQNDLGIKYGDAIVVGVSGGPDSMALLFLTNRLKKSLKIELICAHINHNVRSESKEEKEFVQSWCAKKGIIFESMTVKDYGFDNFQNEARDIRYNFYDEVVKKYRAVYLFTAHHGDDLIETILMRIVRGSTLRGYSGFSQIIKRDNYFIVRPFICLAKEDIYTYLKENKIKYCEDHSNEKDVYTRNRFRKYVVPVLKKENKDVHDKFYKFSKILLQYNDYIDKVTKEQLKTVYCENVLNIDKYKKIESLIQMQIIYYILEYVYQNKLMLINDYHVSLIYDLIYSQSPNGGIHLPNNIQAIKSYNILELVNKEQDISNYKIEISKYINLPNGKNIEIINDVLEDSNYYCRLDSKELKMPLYVRNKMDGDKITIKGMLGRKKVSDIFINEKVSLKERRGWPVVVDANNNVVWLPGLKKSKYDKTKDEKYDIIFKYY